MTNCSIFAQCGWNLDILEIQSCYSGFPISYILFRPFAQCWAEASHKLSAPLFEDNAIVPEPLLHCLGCVLRLMIMLEGEPLSPPEALVFIKMISVCGSIQLPINPDYCPICQLLKNTLTAWCCCHGIGQVMSGAWFPPNKMLQIKAEKFNLWVMWPENLVSHSLRVL